MQETREVSILIRLPVGPGRPSGEGPEGRRGVLEPGRSLWALHAARFIATSERNRYLRKRSRPLNCSKRLLS